MLASRAGYRERVIILHQWLLCFLLRHEVFDLTDLLLAQMEDVIYEGIGACQLPFAPYICLLLRTTGVMTETEYAVLPEITAVFSPAEPFDSRVLRVSASQSTPGGEEITAPDEFELETEASEGAQPWVGCTETPGLSENHTSSVTLDLALAARLDTTQAE